MVRVRRMPRKLRANWTARRQAVSQYSRGFSVWQILWMTPPSLKWNPWTPIDKLREKWFETSNSSNELTYSIAANSLLFSCFWSFLGPSSWRAKEDDSYFVIYPIRQTFNLSRVHLDIKRCVWGVYEVLSLHGRLKRQKRKNTERSFASGSVPTGVAPDVAFWPHPHCFPRIFGRPHSEVVLRNHSGLNPWLDNISGIVRFYWTSHLRSCSK